jgi:hypothetical protein
MTAETAAATSAAVSVDAIDAALAAATRSLNQDEQRLAVAVFRLLSADRPASIPAAAAAAAIPDVVLGRVPVRGGPEPGCGRWFGKPRSCVRHGG